MGSILQFAQSVQKNSLKACVVVVTQMLVVLRGDGRNTQVTRDDWAIVQKNLSYMQLATNVALPTEISFAQNSMLNTVCKVFSRLPQCERTKIYKAMFDGMPNFSLRFMSKYLAAHESASTGGALQTVSDKKFVPGRKDSRKPKPAPAEKPLVSEVAAGSSVYNTNKSKTQSAPPEAAVDKELATGSRTLKKRRSRSPTPAPLAAVMDLATESSVPKAKATTRRNKARSEGDVEAIEWVELMRVKEMEISREWAEAIKDRPDWRRDGHHLEQAHIILNATVMRFKLLYHFENTKGTTLPSQPPQVGGRFRLTNGL